MYHSQKRMISGLRYWETQVFVADGNTHVEMTIFLTIRAHPIWLPTETAFDSHQKMCQHEGYTGCTPLPSNHANYPIVLCARLDFSSGGEILSCFFDGSGHKRSQTQLTGLKTNGILYEPTHNTYNIGYILRARSLRRMTAGRVLHGLTGARFILLTRSMGVAQTRPTETAGLHCTVRSTWRIGKRYQTPAAGVPACPRGIMMKDKNTIISNESSYGTLMSNRRR